MCRGSSLALNHEAPDLRVDDPFLPLPFKGNYFVSQFGFVCIAVQPDILAGAASGVYPATQHISNVVVFSRDIPDAEIELAEGLMPTSNTGGWSRVAVDTLCVPISQGLVVRAHTDCLEPNVARPFA